MTTQWLLEAHLVMLATCGVGAAIWAVFDVALSRPRR